MEDIQETKLEEPIKIKKARTPKQIQALVLAREKRDELRKINRDYSDVTKKDKEKVIENKKRVIQSAKEIEEEQEVDVKPQKSIKKKAAVVEESSEEEEEEIVVKRKPKSKKIPVKKTIIYADTSSSEDEDEINEQVVNYAKLVKRSAREKLKEQLNHQKLQQCMASLGYC